MYFLVVELRTLQRADEVICSVDLAFFNADRILVGASFSPTASNSHVISFKPLAKRWATETSRSFPVISFDLSLKNQENTLHGLEDSPC